MASIVLTSAEFAGGLTGGVAVGAVCVDAAWGDGCGFWAKAVLMRRKRMLTGMTSALNVTETDFI
jgi:hypothetical protein